MPCAILHLLEDGVEGAVQVMPRQSGKSTKIARMADACDIAGYRVIVFVQNRNMGRFFKEKLRKGSKVVVMSVIDQSSTPNRLNGEEPAILFSDEVRDDIVRKIVELLPACRFVLGLRS
jgi:hypothetical protein